MAQGADLPGQEGVTGPHEGGATAEDVLTLMDLVRMTVKDMSGVELEPEVRIIGEEKRKL